MFTNVPNDTLWNIYEPVHLLFRKDFLLHIHKCTHSHQQTHIHTLFTYSVSHNFWATIFIGSVVILYYAWFIFWWFIWAISRTQSFVLFTQTKEKYEKISIEINRTVDCCIYFGTNGIYFIFPLEALDVKMSSNYNPNTWGVGVTV